MKLFKKKNNVFSQIVIQFMLFFVSVNACSVPIINVFRNAFLILCFWAASSYASAFKLTASPTNSSTGNFTLSWSKPHSMIGAYQIYENGALVGTQADLTKSFTGKALGTYRYHIVGLGVGSPSSNIVVVTVTHPKPTVNITFDPDLVESGKTSKLIWSSTHANGCPGVPGQQTTGSKLYPINRDSDWTVNVTCKGPGGQVSSSATLRVIPPRPKSPRFNDGPVSTDGEFYFDWDPPATGAPVKFYQWRLGSGSWFNSGTTTNGTNQKRGNGTYTFSVRACFSTHRCSPAVSATIRVEKLISPGPIRNIISNDGATSTDGQFTLSWSPPTSGGAVAYYRWRVNNGGWTNINSSSLPQNRPNGAYSYQIQACNAAGCSTAIPITVKVNIPVAPGPVTNLNVQGTGANIMLVWSAPITGGIVSNYQYLRSAGGWVSIGLSRSIPINKRPNGGYENYSVRACNQAGCGSANSLVTLPVVPSVKAYWQPERQYHGKPQTIFWSSQSALSCSSPAHPHLEPSGSITVPSGNNGTTMISCDGFGGRGTASAKRYLRAPTITRAEFVPNVIEAGGETTLYWDSIGAVHCQFANGAKVDTSGTRTKNYTQSHVGAITCFGPDGQQSSTIQTPVTVISPARLISPVEDYIVANEGSGPCFNWSKVSGADHYAVEVSRDANFTSSWIVEDTQATQVCWNSGTGFVGVGIQPTNPPVNLENGYHHYWRVRAVNDSVNPPVDALSDSTFFVPKAVLPIPLLVEPENNQRMELNTTGEPCFVWSAVEGATHYNLQVSSTGNFEQTRWVKLGIEGTSTCWNQGEGVERRGDAAGVPTNFQPNQPYYWRIRASHKNSGLVTATSVSAARQFMVNDFVLGTLDQVMLISPLENYIVENIGNNPCFTWQAVDGATHYSIQVSRDADFDSYWVNTDSQSTEQCWANGDGFIGASAAITIPPQQLENGQTHYWRVVAKNGVEGAVTALSTSESTFFVPKGVLEAGELISPVNEAELDLIDDDEPCFSWEPVTGATHYNLQVSTNTDFDNGRWLKLNIEDTSTCWDAGANIVAIKDIDEVPESLLVGETYYWRVRARTLEGELSVNTSVTDYREFTVASSEQPGASLGYIPSAPAPVDVNALYQSAQNRNDLVGSIAGAFRVNESGAATYSIPLSLPAGTAGVAPELTLNYSSQVGKGLLGQGWSLGGLSSISRCRQTLAIDGNMASISLTAEDRFCLDGQRLMLVEGARYGSVGAVYRTEMESFAKVTSVGGEVGHPEYFRVERKDGSVSFYGINSTSNHSQLQLGDNNTTFTWAISQFQDNVGNAIQFNYGVRTANDNNGNTGPANHRIESIRYAFGFAGTPDVNTRYVNLEGATAHARVEFNYADILSEKTSRYIAGYYVENNSRLSNIQIYNSNQEIKAYKLNYLPTDAKNLSRIKSIEECAHLSGACLPATHFTWTASLAFPNQFGSPGVATDKLSSKDDRYLQDYQVGDFNGDGNTDLAWLELDVDGDDTDYQIHYMLFNPKNNLLEPALFLGDSGALIDEVTFGEDHNETIKMSVIDYNADGQSDLAVYANRDPEWKVFLSVPAENGWRLSIKAKDTVYTGLTTADVQFVDINGDGLVDVMSGGSGIYRYRLMEKDSSQLTTSRHYYRFGEQNSFSIGLSDTIVSGQRQRVHEQKVTGDFNGDGGMDMLITQNRHNYSGYTTNIEDRDHRAFVLGMVNGQLGVVKNLRSISCESNGPCSIDLHNGEGPFEVENNAGFQYQFAATQSADFNGDGLTDIYWGKYQLNRGDGSFTETRIIEHLNTDSELINGKHVRNNLQMLDYNRDGFTDIVQHREGKLQAFLWNGDGFSDAKFIANAPMNLHTDQYIVMDMNGDGAHDYLKAVRLGDSGEAPIQLTSYLSNDFEPRNMINRITNGLGAVTNIDYESMARSDHYANVSNTKKDTIFNRYYLSDEDDFYTAINSNYDNFARQASAEGPGVTGPAFEIKPAAFLVTRVESSSPTAANNNAMAAIEYFYGEAKIQASGRGLLGFEKLKTVDVQTNVETTTTYHQDYPFIGHPRETVVRSPHGHRLSQATNDWNYDEIIGADGTRRYFTKLNRSIERTFDLVNNGQTQGGLIQTATTYTYYDGDEDNKNDTTSANDEVYGNATRVVAITHGDLDGEGPVVDSTDSYSKSTINQYGTTLYELEMGRLSRTVVITRRNDSRGEQINTRESKFTYYGEGDRLGARGLLKTEILEPSKPPFTLTTTYHYDEVGNKVRAIQSGAGMTNRFTRTVYDNEAKRYVNETYNALFSQPTTVVRQRNKFGAPTVVADINGNRTYKAYDNLGRQFFEGADTGASSETRVLRCSTDGACPSNAVIATHVINADGSEGKSYLDKLGRTVRESTRGFDGRWIHKDTQYDVLGRVARTSEPYVGSPQFWTTINHYDLLGRPLSSNLPGAATPANMRYEGYTVTSTTPVPKDHNVGLEKIEVKNVLGELVKVIDHDGAEISYHYDAIGNLHNLISHGIGNEARLVTEVVYDALGRKISMNDPDKGQWRYCYNAFGELTGQIDANGNATVMQYDILGRMVHRQDLINPTVSFNNTTGGCTITRRTTDDSIESNTNWTYYSVGSGIGQLANVRDSMSGYTQSYSYDHFGRASQTTTTIEYGSQHTRHTTQAKVEYDHLGRAFRSYDASGTVDGINSWKTGAVETLYNQYGYTERLVDAEIKSGQQKPYYQVSNMDVRGNATRVILGNGLATTRWHDPATGLLENITTTGLSVMQNLDYRWDDVGNLEYREDKLEDLREDFYYDTLNRLVRSSINGQDKITEYDSLGNIRSKANVGNYRYGAECAASLNAGPHAVCSTGDGVNYRYDNNGNMVADSLSNNGLHGGRNIHYTVFDKPDVITRTNSQGTYTTKFAYGPDRARYWKEDTDTENKVTTTLYLGGVEQVIEDTGNVKVKRYIGGHLILIHDYANEDATTVSSFEENYLLHDHLGSLDLITNGNGATISDHDGMSFDAWGNRRTADWADVEVPIEDLLDLAVITNVTPRGFTGHEMLDGVGLIHMNGRIYDPRLGRFMQADPFIQAASDTQMLNRYSYVRNNPLNATDPSGFIIPALVGVLMVAFEIGTVIEIAVVVGSLTMAQALRGGASFGDALKAGLIAGLSSWAFGSITGGEGFLGEVFQGTLGKAFGMGVVGGITSTLQGGKFGHGFASAFLSGLSASIPGLGYKPGQFLKNVGRGIVKTTIAGTISEITGGKFKNGAASAAMNFVIDGAVQSYRNRQVPYEPLPPPDIDVPISNPNIDISDSIAVMDYTVAESPLLQLPPVNEYYQKKFILDGFSNMSEDDSSSSNLTKIWIIKDGKSNVNIYGAASKMTAKFPLPNLSRQMGLTVDPLKVFAWANGIKVIANDIAERQGRAIGHSIKKQNEMYDQMIMSKEDRIIDGL